MGETCVGMCGTCTILSGVVVLVAGVSFAGLLGAAVAGMASGTFGGWLLALYGLAILIHGLKLCPMCK